MMAMKPAMMMHMMIALMVRDDDGADGDHDSNGNYDCDDAADDVAVAIVLMMAMKPAMMVAAALLWQLY